MIKRKSVISKWLIVEIILVVLSAQNLRGELSSRSGPWLHFGTMRASSSIGLSEPSCSGLAKFLSRQHGVKLGSSDSSLT